jgi:putative addiction module killer protein
LRIHHGAGYRVYFTEQPGTLIVLLCGGDKATQAKDIASAKKIACDLKD